MMRMGIHEILCMEDYFSRARTQPRTPSRRFRRSLLQVLQDRRYRLLLHALEKTGLSDRLAASGPYTVFAPSDEAFTKSYATSLLENPNRMRAALSRHIVWGHLDLNTIFEMDLLAPINGEAIAIDSATGLVENRKVIQPNMRAPNGIVHGISGLFARFGLGR